MALKFDRNRSIMYAYKNDCAIPDIKKAYALNASVYNNAQKYYNDPQYLRHEMVNKWFPAFQRMLGVTNEQFALEDIQIREQAPSSPMYNKMFKDEHLDKIDWNTKIHQKGSKIDHFVKYDVYMKFKIKGFTNTEYVPVMSIPWVREDGIIEYNGAEYAFIHMLEQTDGISYNPNNTNKNPPRITLRTNRNNIGLFNNEKDGIIAEVGKGNKIDMLSLVSAVLRKENPSINPTEYMNSVWDEFADSDIVNLKLKLGDKFFTRWYYSGGSTKRRGVSDVMEKFAPRICGLSIDNEGKPYDMYSTVNLRENLNALLSLKQAVNKKLVRNVVSKDGNVLARRGTIVTETLVDTFNRNGIYIIYVEDNVDISGAILDEDIITPVIPRGTLVTDEIEAAFPEEDGMYVCKDYYAKDYIGKGFDDVFMIDKGTILDNSHIDRIKSSGREGIYIQVGKKRRYVSFVTEIISNKQFKGEWCGKESGKWFYLNSDGEYETQIGLGYTAYDLIALWSYAVKALRGNPTIKLPNIDEDFRKELVPINEQFSRAMNYSIANGMKQMKQTFAAFWKSDKIVMFTQQDSELIYKFYAFERLFWEYLTKEAKCVRMIPASALNNPIAYISEITKANVYAASKNSVSDPQRVISIGSYGKIDPYEIPQSGKIGIVNNLCSYVNIDDDGHITTPYYRVKHNGGKARVCFEEGYHQMTVEEEEKYVIADICSITIDADGNIKERPDDLVLCMVPGGNGSNRRVFDKMPLSRVQYINVNAMQPLSWASSTIPFLCNNDAARAVFAVAQMKQAKGLEYPEEPLVMTSAYEMIPRLNRKFGYVCNKDEHLHYSLRDSKTDCWGIMTADRPAAESLTQPYNEAVDYPEFRQGDNSVMTIKPTIFQEAFGNNWASVPVKEGDTIVASNFTSERGIMQFGVNAFVLFIPDGFNYEDSVHISETFSRKITSYRINEELLPIKPCTRMPRIRDTAEHPISTSIPFAPNSENDTFDITLNDHSKGRVEFQRKLNHAYGTYIGQYGHVKEQKHIYDGVVVQLLSRDAATMGDKLSNRHGNKCTVCSVSNKDMPYINNGIQADAVLNPLGVGSRMNIGQIKEMHLGLVCHVLGIQISTDAYNCINDEEIKTLLNFTWSCANETTSYKKFGHDANHPADLDAVMARPEFNSIPHALKAHVREHIDTIQMWANTFDKSGSFEYYYLEEVEENGEIKKKVSKGKAAGGFLYLFKLTQESYKKVHSRANDMSDEEYSKLTDAPTHGAARGGGQRMGTMEIDALCAYDVRNYIHELFNVRADNAIARENFNIDTYFDPKEAKKYKREGEGQRRAVTELMYTLLALGIMPESLNGEFLPLSKNNGEELRHIKGQYLQRKVGKTSRKRKAEEDGDEQENNEVPVTEPTVDPDFKEMAHSVISHITY